MKFTFRSSGDALPVHTAPVRRGRMAIIVLCLIAGFGLFVWKSYRLQVVLAEENLARAGWRTDDVLSYQGGRGNIVDRRGSLLAGAAPAFDLDYRRSAILSLPAPDRDRVLRALERFPRFSRESFDEWASSDPLRVSVGLDGVDVRRRGDWARLAYGVSPEEVEALRASLGSIDMSWLTTIPTFRRTYPRESLAGWVIGYASRSGAGASSGLERMFDDELSAGSVRVGLVRDEDREPYLRGELVEFADAAGATVETTLDAELQAVADRAVAEMVERESALRGVAIVSRVGTGEVLAMTTYPPFDPGAPITEENAPGADWATTAVVEPGSTIKMFTFAAAIDAGVIGYDTELDCANGVLRVPGATYRDDHCDGTIAAWDALRVSSNIGAIRMAMRMSAQQHYAYLRGFGFGQRTGLDVPVEARGNLPSAERGWEAYRQASISYGYAMGLTPIQLNVATAALGNGGVRMAPYLVRRVVSADGAVLYERSPEPVIRVVSERAARLTTRAMETVVTDDEGTASAAAVPGYRVAGKTGTVERWDEEARAYEDGQYLSSFSGFVPADSPRFAITVMIDRPDVSDGVFYGGQVAAPVFSEIAATALTLDGLDVEDEDAPADVAVDDTAVQALAAASAGARSVPNFVGMTVREALQASTHSGVPISVEGAGRVVVQSEPAGDLATPQTHVFLRLAEPAR